MLTFTVTLPNRGRRRAELAEATENRQSATAELNAEVQRRQAEVQDQYVMARTAAEQLRILREGLMPQSEAAFRAATAAYQANRQDFETLLSSFRDALDFEEQYQKELSEHESALARLESLTGVTLP
jgi:outer membrane protein TolC